MDSRFIMTAFGKDRPGIVADVTKILFENGCNLEETTMTQLADEFTLILLFSGSAAGLEELLGRECRRLEKETQISAFVRPLAQRQEIGPRKGETLILHVEGVDQAGIVYRVSQYLADLRLNIVDLSSAVTASPGSGTLLYLMDIQVEKPTAEGRAVLEEGLAAVADELHVDIAIRS